MYDMLEATMPSRLGRDGLRVGKKAPDFRLPSVTGPEIALHDSAGRRLLLVFTQAGCRPCHDIVPELNRLQHKGEPCVVVVNNGGPAAGRELVEQAKARFLVLVQEQFSLSKRYQVFATPFAFLIDEEGIITSKGVCGSKQHLAYVVSGAGNRTKKELAEAEAGAGEDGEAGDNLSASPKEAASV